MVDDMEARRLLVDVLKLTAWTSFRTRIDRNPERPERLKHQMSESFAAADKPAARASTSAQ